MKKIILTAVMFFVINSIATAQKKITIGTVSTDTTALLEVNANNKGVLIPRLTNAQMVAIVNPGNGLLVYNTDSAAFAYRAGTAWVFLKGNTTASNDWSTKGNAGTDTSKNFIGTTDNVDLIFKRNSERSGILTITNTSWGYRALRATLPNSASNTAIGAYALQLNNAGNQNTAIGAYALSSNTSGIGNTTNGYQSLYSNNTGVYNTASGANALYFNDLGSQNTANGYRALTFNRTGNNNTAVGANALFFNTDGYSNVAVGNEALNSNRNRSNLVAIGDSALYNNGLNATDNAEATKNTAVGSKALFSNNTGYNNTAHGYESLKTNSIGYNNTAIGGQALGSNDIGSRNTATGFGALFSNNSGNENTANGTQALLNNIDGSGNTAMGFQSLYLNNSGQSNVAIGAKALYSNTDRGKLVAIGEGALYNNGIGANALSDATFNTAVGFNALFANTTGNENTAIGTKALAALTVGSNNIAVGSDALGFNETGSDNVVLGSGAGFGNTTGSGNIFIGKRAGAAETGSNKLYISNSDADANNALMYGEFNANRLRVNNKLGIGISPLDFPLEIKGTNFFNDLIKLYNDAGVAKWHVKLLGNGSLNFTETGVGDNRLVLGVGGEAGIGKVPLITDNDSRLQIKQKGSQNGIGVEAENSTNHWDFYATSTAASNFNLYYNSVFKGAFNNVTGAYTAASDRRMKKDITPQQPVLNAIMQLQAFQYHYLDNKTTDNFSNGFMAQDVQKIFPDAVVENTMKDGETRLGINYQYFTVLAIKGLQEQQQQIQSQGERIAKLESLVKTLMEKK